MLRVDLVLYNFLDNFLVILSLLKDLSALPEVAGMI